MGTPLPPEESERLDALHRYRIVDTPPEPVFDAIAAAAAALTGCPYGAVTFVDRDRCWYKALAGLGIREIPRDVAFCSWAILSDEVMVVDDAQGDGRFAASPLVADPAHVGRYAGAAIETPERHRLGAVCVMHREPGPFGAAESGVVRWLATLASAHLEARLRALLEIEAERARSEVTRRAEQHAREAMKMEAVSRLAGGAAHSLNNLLTIVTGYSQLLRDALHAEDPLHRYAEEIYRAADRAAALTSKLLDFSRHRLGSPRLVEIDSVARNVIRTMDRQIPAQIAIATDFAAGPTTVLADWNAIEHAVRELVHNAAEAMPRGGQIAIRTFHSKLDREAADMFGVAPGEFVVLEVEDSGPGMEAEARSHLFEPFFSTRGLGRGTGLASVYGIVKQCGGHVAVSSEVGHGTRVSMFLPVAGAQENNK